MPIYQNGEIDTMLADWGHSLAADGITAPCLFEERDQLGLEQDGAAGQLMHIITATVKTSDFPILKGGDPLTVDGKDYIVWRRLLLGDGGLTELWLRVV